MKRVNRLRINTRFINSLFSTTAGVLLLDERIHVTICMVIHNIYYHKTYTSNDTKIQ